MTRTTMRVHPLLVMLIAVLSGALGAARAEWSPREAQAILARTQTVTLAPDLSGLSAGERTAVGKLIEAGAIVQSLYERQVHAGAALALADLERRAAKEGAGGPAHELLQLYRLFKGPIATTLANTREPFVDVAPSEPGKGVYPPGTTREQVEAFLQSNPTKREALMQPLTVLRRSDAATVRADLATLDRYAALDVLHPGLRRQLDALAATPDAAGFYALPYSVAWPEEILRIHRLLNDAADAVHGDDPEFAGYLRNRSRDFISDDYESGDAAWVTAKFRRLNGQIGAFETYDDELFGTRAFLSLSVLVERPEETRRVRAALGSLQAIQDALPYKVERKVRGEIPIGVYDVVADFGQARGGNTASILPNDPLHAARYGRTILLRANIMEHPVNRGNAQSIWNAAVKPQHASDLGPQGSSQRTLWHEIGHYLGVDVTRDGRNLDVALQDDGNLLEEMKADLVAAHAAAALHRSGYYDDAGLRSVQAAAVLRVLQRAKPRRDQAYQTMQLMQWNYFMRNGLLSFDPRTRRLAIDYSRFGAVVDRLLGEVLKLQADGDKAAADRYIDEYTTWDPKLHEVIAKQIRDALKYRYTAYRYSAVDGE